MRRCSLFPSIGVPHCLHIISWLFFLSFAGSLRSAFVTPPRNNACFSPEKVSSAYQRNIACWSFLQDNNGNSDLGQNFNPFDYKKTRENQSAYGVSGSQISLRKTRMQLIVNELLNVVNDKTETQRILQEHSDFLMEPLEDDGAVLDPDSIYTSNMSRSERYDAYEQSMEERLNSARNPSVKTVLQALKDFVLSHRNNS